MRGWVARAREELRDDRGSSPVEFVLVGVLLTVLTLGVLQLGLAIYVRNVIHDAAVDGAFHAALADTAPADGATRTRDILRRTVGEAYATDVTARVVSVDGHVQIEVAVRAPLPLVGLLGAPRTLEVSARAPQESLG